MVNYEQITKSLRQDIIKMIYTAQSGHPGGACSIIDILAVLYFGKFIQFDAKKPEWEERDYLILSKGHASAALYAVLAELSFFKKDELFLFRQVNSLLQGHPVKKIPGIEVSTGSLGQGLSVANGIALGKPEKKVFAILGDGELQEGQVWEAVMTAYHYKLSNLVAIVDKNNLQIDGSTEDLKSLGKLSDKFKSFNWQVFEIDGHNFTEIEKTLNQAIAVKDKPSVIIANTVKGKGISFMENNVKWHGKAPNEEEYEQAMQELNI